MLFRSGGVHHEDSRLVGVVKLKLQGLLQHSFNLGEAGVVYLEPLPCDVLLSEVLCLLEHGTESRMEVAELGDGSEPPAGLFEVARSAESQQGVEAFRIRSDAVLAYKHAGKFHLCRNLKLLFRKRNVMLA